VTGQWKNAIRELGISFYPGFGTDEAQAQAAAKDFNQAPVSAPHTFVTDFPIGSFSTSAPTKDMCYGNMAKNPKFSLSEMPSVSPDR
jgi:hypothetical protein